MTSESQSILHAESDRIWKRSTILLCNIFLTALIILELSISTIPFTPMIDQHSPIQQLKLRLVKRQARGTHQNHLNSSGH